MATCRAELALAKSAAGVSVSAVKSAWPMIMPTRLTFLRCFSFSAPFAPAWWQVPLTLLRPRINSYVCVISPRAGAVCFSSAAALWSEDHVWPHGPIATMSSSPAKTSSLLQRKLVR